MARVTATAVPVYPPLPRADGGTAAVNDDARRLGGRLFDDFTKELSLDFVPDDPSTPAADGKGGPFGDGTLPDAQGKPLLNTGHGYRLKALLGADLHGAAGIAGRQAAAGSAGVLLPDLLKNTDPRELWIERLTRGEDAIPAYASVLSSTQIGAIVDFLLGVRDGTLPHPDALFTLDEQVPEGFYRLAPGGVAERGQGLIAQRCAGCTTYRPRRCAPPGSASGGIPPRPWRRSSSPGSPTTSTWGSAATPLWWGSVPAVLKGFFDRALLPQQEYRYTNLGLPVGMLPARRGRLLLLADTPWYAAPFTGLPAQTQVTRNTMRLCGIRSVRTHRMLGVKDASPARIDSWLARAATLGARDGIRDAAHRADTPLSVRELADSTAS